MPSRSFSEMLKMLKQFVSFMSMTVSIVGVVNVKYVYVPLEIVTLVFHIFKYLGDKRKTS